jgi:hypothetical protein
LTKVEDAFPQASTHGSMRGHEPNKIVVRGLVIAAAALVGTGIVVQIILALVMEQFAHKEQQLDSLYPGRMAIDVDQFPIPRLQENPSVDLARQRAEERRRFDAYGWVDRKAGIAHIPVERAMDILARTGLPKVPAPAPAIGAPPRTSIPPGTKREEARPVTDSPPPTKSEQPRPQSKKGLKP